VSEIEQVLDYWFGASAADGSLDPTRKKMWFGDGRKHDAEIRDRFGALHERAGRGELDAEWTATPRGTAALVVVLDQLSRHIHRDTPAAFACDPPAQLLVTTALDRRLDRELIPPHRAFFYLPLEHAEDLELQRLAVRCYDGLARTVPEAQRREYEGFLDYAQRHLEIIRRFRRFPHRNRILGRASTPEEIEFLKQPGSAF
jgi:uncharacterized protein (DUF924 family)